MYLPLLALTGKSSESKSSKLMHSTNVPFARSYSVQDLEGVRSKKRNGFFGFPQWEPVQCEGIVVYVRRAAV